MDKTPVPPNLTEIRIALGFSEKYLESQEQDSILKTSGEPDMGLKFGIEIETVGVTPEHVMPKFQQALIPAEFGTKLGGEYRKWMIGTDGSLPTHNNCEVASPVNPPWPQIRQVIDLLKQAGGYTNEACGLHIHVSDPSINHLRCVLPPTPIWTPRLRHVAKYDRPDMSPKYKVASCIRQRSENHLEIRVFNGRLSYHYVLWAFGLVKRSLIRINDHYEAERTFNDCDPIPVEYGQKLPKPKRKVVGQPLVYA